MFKLPFGSKAPPSPASHVCEILVEIEQREAEKWVGGVHRPGVTGRFVLGERCFADLETVQCENGWRWVGEWSLCNDSGADADGWMYAEQFPEDFHAACVSVAQGSCRWRKWQRTKIRSKNSLFASLSAGFKADTPKADRAERPVLQEQASAVSSSADSSSKVDGDFPDLDSDNGDFDDSDSVPDQFSETDSTLGIDSDEEEPSTPKRMPPRLKDPQLTAIAKQLRAVEVECEKTDTQDDRDWIAFSKPAYKAQIAAMQGEYKNLKKQMDEMHARGEEPPIELKNEVEAFAESLDDMKKRLYFPKSRIVAGGNGVFVAMDDFFLERVSGQYILDLVPNPESPQILLSLCGTDSDSNSGVSCRLLIDNFKMRGDKGMKIPRLSFRQLKITAVVKVQISLNFNLRKNVWEAPSKLFKIEMLSFKGPFGTRKSLIAPTLNLVMPLIRQKLVQVIPPELGVLVSTLSSPFSLRGDFDILGTPLRTLTKSFYKNEQILRMLQWRVDDAQHFVVAQQSMDRSNVLKSMLDVIHYRRFTEQHRKPWKSMRCLWSDALRVYTEKWTAESTQLNNLNFEKVLLVAEQLMRSPLRINLAMSRIEGELNIRAILECVFTIMQRFAQEAIQKNERKRRDDASMGPLMMFLRKVQDTYVEQATTLNKFTELVEELALRVIVKMQGGPNANLVAHVYDVDATLLQISQALLMTSPMRFGFQYVPFVVSIMPQENGKLRITVRHLTDPGMTNAAEYERRLKELAEKAAAAENETASDSVRLSRMASESASVASSGNTQQQQSDDNLPYAEIVAVELDSYEVSFVLKTHRALQREDVLNSEEITLFSVQLGPSAAADPSAAPGGVPIRIKTSAMKACVHVSHAVTTVGIMKLWRFLRALFSNIPQFQAYLPEGLATVQQLELGRTVIECLEKYLRSEHLKFECNMTAGLRSVNSDLILQASAPSVGQSDEEQMHGFQVKPLQLCMKVDVQDVFADFRTIKAALALV